MSNEQHEPRETRPPPFQWLVYREYGACVIINDVPVTCFSPEYTDSKDTASAWIPSESNKTFSIYYRKTVPDDHDYCMTLYLDGKKVACAVVRKNSGTKIYLIGSIPVSATETKDFVFNPAALTDDDTFLDSPISSGVGEIKVVLQAVKITKETKPPETSYSEPSGAEKIHETSKTGLIHQVGYELNKTQSSAVPSKWLLYDPIGKPVNLVFRYRSLDVLQANGIAPRPAAPLPPPIKMDERELEMRPSDRHSSYSAKTSKRMPNIQASPKPKVKEGPELKPEGQINLSEAKLKQETKMMELQNKIDPDQEAIEERLSQHEESSDSDEEDTNQIVIDSLRTLLLNLEKATNKKRARKDASKTKSSSKKAKSDSFVIDTAPTSSFYHALLAEATDSPTVTPAKEEPVTAFASRPKKEKKSYYSIPANAQVIDLT